MAWKSFIPLAGKKSVRRKLNEIEDEAGTLATIFGVLFAKVIEQMVVLKFGDAVKFLIASMMVALIYIYKHEAKKKAKEVKEEVTE